MRPAYKIHIHGDNPSTAEGASGSVTEALCELFKPTSVVVAHAVYTDWMARGYTQDIFCGNCVRVLTE